MRASPIRLELAMLLFFARAYNFSLCCYQLEMEEVMEILRKSGLTFQGMIYYFNYPYYPYSLLTVMSREGAC